MAHTQFSEQQTIPSSWRLLIFGGVTIMMGFIFIMILQNEWDSMPPEERPFLLTLLLGPIGTLVVFFIRLDTRITSTMVEFKVHPFRKEYKQILFDKINAIELSKPKGLKSMKGIGSNRQPNRTDLNFGGKFLVTITMTKGKVLTFSTNKPQELKSFLQNLPEGGPQLKIEI